MSGFGPLYNLYYGDHKATEAGLPWFHLILPERFLINRLNKKKGLRLSCIKDLGLNQLNYSDYLRIFEQASLQTTYFKTNGAGRLISKVFRVLAKIPILREYFTQSIYIKIVKAQ